MRWCSGGLQIGSTGGLKLGMMVLFGGNDRNTSHWHNGCEYSQLEY
jgi:hypothetical protein